MDYLEWERDVPGVLKQDALWSMKVYRLALFAADLGWNDVTCLARDRRTISLSDQLYRALGSISANIAEGYSRGTGKDRARFYEYALGSARESRDWYFKGRHVLKAGIADHRLELLTQVIRLLLTIVPHERNSQIREESPGYYTSGADLNGLLENIPTAEPRTHAIRTTQ